MATSRRRFSSYTLPAVQQRLQGIIHDNFDKRKDSVVKCYEKTVRACLHSRNTSASRACRYESRLHWQVLSVNESVQMHADLKGIMYSLILLTSQVRTCLGMVVAATSLHVQDCQQTGQMLSRAVTQPKD